MTRNEKMINTIPQEAFYEFKSSNHTFKERKDSC
jgi:hypothetical protein